MGSDRRILRLPEAAVSTLEKQLPRIVRAESSTEQRTAVRR